MCSIYKFYKLKRSLFGTEKWYKRIWRVTRSQARGGVKWFSRNLLLSVVWCCCCCVLSSCSLFIYIYIFLGQRLAIYETFMLGSRAATSPPSLELHCPNKKHNKLSTVDRMGRRTCWTHWMPRKGATVRKKPFGKICLFCGRVGAGQGKGPSVEGNN